MKHLLDPDRYSYLIDRQHSFLFIGIMFLVMTAVSTLSGKTLERFHGAVCRTEERKRFWWLVIFYFVSGLFFIGLYLYRKRLQSF